MEKTVATAGYRSVRIPMMPKGVEHIPDEIVKVTHPSA